MKKGGMKKGKWVRSEVTSLLSEIPASVSPTIASREVLCYVSCRLGEQLEGVANSFFKACPLLSMAVKFLRIRKFSTSGTYFPYEVSPGRF